MKVSEASKRARLHTGTLARCIRQGRLPAARKGPRLWDISEADLAAFLRSERKRGRPRTRPVHAPRFRHLTPEQRAQIVALWRAQVPQREIARRIGYSAGTVSRVLRRALFSARRSRDQDK